MHYTYSTIHRLFTHIEPGPNGCWNYTGARDKDGYGRLYYYTGAHRIMYELTENRALESGECVLHHCDNPSCVNPKHLFVGSHMDNHLDKIAKGRENYTGQPPKGKVGTRFGTLTIVRDTGRRADGSVVWEWFCDCGATVERSYKSVRQSAQKGFATSCHRPQCQSRASQQPAPDHN